MSEKKFNTTITPLRFSKNDSGNAYWILGEGQVEEIKKALGELEQGGMILFKKNKYGKNEKSPDAYVEYVSRENVEAFQGNRNSVATEETV